MSDSLPEAFTHVAPYYEALMKGVPYEQWVRYLEELLTLYNARPRRVLDLACGTGTVTRILARKGYRMAGVDGSEAMVREAKRLTPGDEADFFCQRMESLNLERRFDLVVSLFDSLNYVTEPEGLQRCFCRVAEHLEPGGMFIFDMNAEYAFTADLFTQESIGHRRRIEYSWKSHYNPETRLCRVDMQFYIRNGGVKQAFEEVHIQRAYRTEEVSRMLEEAGLTVLATYDAYTTNPIRAKSDRIFWVAKKVSEGEEDDETP